MLISMTIKGVGAPKCEAFLYLGSMIQNNYGIKDDLDKKITAEWMR